MMVFEFSDDDSGTVEPFFGDDDSGTVEPFLMFGDDMPVMNFGDDDSGTVEPF